LIAIVINTYAPIYAEGEVLAITLVVLEEEVKNPYKKSKMKTLNTPSTRDGILDSRAATN